MSINVEKLINIHSSASNNFILMNVGAMWYNFYVIMFLGEG